mgnify:FL=1
MAPIDLAVVAAVALLMFLAIRYVLCSGDKCAGCGSSGSCAAHVAGRGECPAAAGIVADVEKRLRDSSSR